MVGRFERGEIFRFDAGTGPEAVKVLDGNSWVSPSFPVTGGMIMDSRPLKEAEIADLTSRGIELK